MNDQEKFEAYEEVRASGVTNMFDINKVSELSGLNKDDVRYVMHNYSSLSEKYDKN